MPYLLAILALVLAPSAAYANALTGTADIPVGEMVHFAAPYISWLLYVVAFWVIQHLSAPVRGFLQTMHVEKTIADAIIFGKNSIVGVTRDVEIPLPLANPVAVLAVEYALSHVQPWAVSALGTPEQLAEKVWAKLDLPAEAFAPDFDDIAARAQA